jgi:UDP-N-acetylglucosamine 2-epimerase
MCGALASFYLGIPVGHVEAGLRSGDMRQPFPEEMNRSVTSRLATLHFAPTPDAEANLRAEDVAASQIAVTGNTGIDALLHIAGQLRTGRLTAPHPEAEANGRKLIVVSAHRRENLGERIDGICRALARIAVREDVQVVFPVHPNPGVRGPVRRLLGGIENVTLVEPLDYIPFVGLMSRAYLMLTDSGGIQEEAPSLGIPVLVMREKTERPEGVRAGAARLVGTAEDCIVEETTRLLDDHEAHASMARVRNPYGDGRASQRVAGKIAAHFAEDPSSRTWLPFARAFEGHAAEIQR